MTPQPLRQTDLADASFGRHPSGWKLKIKPMQLMQEKQLLPADRDRGAEAWKLKQNLQSNFYLIITDSAPPTCQGDKQDNDHAYKQW